MCNDSGIGNSTTVAISMNADVFCDHGNSSKFSYAIVNPNTWKLTHFVVHSQEFFNSTKRLVPINRVAETSSDLIRFNCSPAELASMEAFIETHYIQRESCSDYVEYPLEMSLYWPGITPITETIYIPIEDKNIPPGEVAVHRGAQVKSTTGHVGKVYAFLVEPTSWHITHLVLQTGLLWWKKKLSLPVSAIEHLSEDTVYLKLDHKGLTLLGLKTREFFNQRINLP